MLDKDKAFITDKHTKAGLTQSKWKVFFLEKQLYSSDLISVIQNHWEEIDEYLRKTDSFGALYYSPKKKKKSWFNDQIC